jgi:hypothetical protein
VLDLSPMPFGIYCDGDTCYDREKRPFLLYLMD